MEEMLSAMLDRLGPEGAADPSLLEAAMELAHKQLERRVAAQKAAASITKAAKKAAETEDKGNVAVTATATDAAGDGERYLSFTLSDKQQLPRPPRSPSNSLPNSNKVVYIYVV